MLKKFKSVKDSYPPPTLLTVSCTQAMHQRQSLNANANAIDFCYFLKSKTDGLDSFEDFKSYTEKQTGDRIKRIRMDNGKKERTGRADEQNVGGALQKHVVKCRPGDAILGGSSGNVVLHHLEFTAWFTGKRPTISHPEGEVHR